MLILELGVTHDIYFIETDERLQVIFTNVTPQLVLFSQPDT